jgi:cysteinyl-tRNA synthetase
MKLYNTLTRNIDPIVPLAAPKVTVYTCGPTVYDYAHIGHWFNYVRMDTLIRALMIDGCEPDWVMNITDVGHLVSDADEGEDKLEKGARREGKTAWQVAEFYTKDFLEGMQLLNITMPGHIVKATDHIAEQIALIQTLEAKGYTYVIDDGVYYDTSKFEGYAAFARLDLDEQQAGARVVYNQQKRNPTDFALWKFSPSNADHTRDMEWDSPWGVGFPGWHIECSAMSMKYLGDTLDIHTGGIDHIQVHHTNEIAQSEAATGKRFANAWMHSNHVMVEGEKISKSLGNGIRVQAIIAKGISPMAIRLHVLESHYRSQSKFSWNSLEAAQNRLLSLQAMADLRWQAVPDRGTTNEAAFTTLTGKTIPQRLSELMLNDLDTPKVLAALSEYESQIVAMYSQADKDSLTGLLEFLDAMLGLDLLSSQDITDEQKQLLKDRQSARDNKNWAQSDALRDQLIKQGIGIRDTGNTPIWYRTT